MSRNLSELLRIGFEHVGDFFVKDSELNLALSKYKHETGSYAFVVDQDALYIGVTTNTLYARMNGYKNPGPTQQTNRRINPKIREAGRVKIYFLPESKILEFTATVQRKEFKKETPIDMGLFERFLISVFKPDWNRE